MVTFKIVAQVEKVTVILSSMGRHVGKIDVKGNFCLLKTYPVKEVGSQYENFLYSLFSLQSIVFATLRLRGRPGRDGCQSAFWDCFGGRICGHVENASLNAR